MPELIEIRVADVRPDPRVVLARQGLAGVDAPSERIATLAQTALDLLRQHAAPAGILGEVTARDFARIYRGEGRNEPETPLEEIFPRAERLALFTVTLGDAVSRKITDLFAERDFALASMLDAAASEGAEQAARIVERQYLESLQRTGAADGAAALAYSPGYCGWHVSGQKALFAHLHPEEIGVKLRESFLMEPLKSISGVIVVGAAEIHEFADAYPFCSECQTRSCRDRIQQVRGA